MQRAEKQTARLTNFNSKSSCHPCFFKSGFTWQISLCFLKKKKKIKKVKKVKGNSITGKEISFPLLTSIYLLYRQVYLQQRPAGMHPRAQHHRHSLQPQSPFLSCSSSAPRPIQSTQLFHQLFQLTSLPKGIDASCSKGVTNHNSEFQGRTWQQLKGGEKGKFWQEKVGED